MDAAAETALARELMADFARRTGVEAGVEGGRPPRRYLWTDAYAVGNFLGFATADGEAGAGEGGGPWTERARRLVDQVHHVLGRHREDDPRQGWISGLGEEEGERHPTAGGLRIGKELPERPPDEPLDPRREWDRDGQYFHYLTRWMHALARMEGSGAGGGDHLRWARELAAAAHAGFTAELPGGGRRMFWKMSIALDRPLVPSQGHHDPLDGLLTFLELETAEPPGEPGLERQIAELAEMCRGTDWTTTDPLGLGGLLADVARLGRLAAAGGAEHGVEVEHGVKVDNGPLLARLAADARVSLDRFAAVPQLSRPAEARLAFRELGLAIGLHAVERLARQRGDAAGVPLDPLLTHLPLAGEIEAFWSDPAHRRGPTWTGHEDINAVMLATSLAPGGWLGGGG